MRRSRFSEEQMVKILHEADKVPVAEVSKKHAARAVARLTHAALGWNPFQAAERARQSTSAMTEILPSGSERGNAGTESGTLPPAGSCRRTARMSGDEGIC